MATTDFIAAIELSSSKISGIAGKKSSDGSIQVLAYAREDASPFIHKGAIYNIDKAAQALTSIINKLEGQLNNSIAKVYVGIGGQSLRTVRNAVSRTLEEESIISQELVDEICDENRDVPLVDMSVLDVAPQEYKIDNTLHVEPVGVAGRYITGQFLNIVARASLKKNLEHSFEQAKVEIADDLLVAPTALAKAVLTETRCVRAVHWWTSVPTPPPCWSIRTISCATSAYCRWVETTLPTTSLPCKWKRKMPRS